METNPRRYLIRMLIFLLSVGIIAGLLAVPLKAAFMGNPALNGVILGAFSIGVLYIVRQTLRLMPERNWLLVVKSTGKLDLAEHRPVVLATVYAMLADSRHDAQLSALSLRSVLDGVAARLDEGREISRYMIGLLIFLGLLGTFWGLLQTIGAVGNVVGSIDTNTDNFEAMMKQLRVGLDAPLSGMATAFSSSLFGLAGSLILGFLDLQLGQAMGRFFNELEDWLSAFARFNDRGPSGEKGQSPLASGMSEEAARALLALSKSIEKGETNRERVLEQVSLLNGTIAQMHEALVDERRIRDQLAQLNANILQLSDDLRTDRNQRTDIVASELRGLSSSIATMMDIKTRDTKGN
ncbi:MAG: MotA/TolQ/ExbB proton channel family protein [Candidatus Puniceispirillum sp.]|nr:MotA/TolQ/ExbB proton channel family protein [Candidatus Puniceispirillum sp.]MBL6774205.1 MotA/TolQ/ExbB proton channel family protein [Candidatus Puniceispirillum sp.]